MSVTIDLKELLDAVERAAEGGSNDAHIVALTNALDTALGELEKSKVVVKRAVIEQVLALSQEEATTLSSIASHAALVELSGNWKDAAGDKEFTIESMLGDLDETARNLKEYANVIRQVSKGVVPL